MKLFLQEGAAREGAAWRFEPSGGELKFELEKPLSAADRFLIFDLTNFNDFDARLEVHFYRANNFDVPAFSFILAVLPNLTTPIVLPFEYLDGQSMNGAARPGILCTAIDGMRLELAEVAAIGIAMSPSHVSPLLEIENVRFAASDEGLHYNFDLSDLIDALGQHKDRDWPGKTKDFTEWKAYLDTELGKAQACFQSEAQSEMAFPEGKFFRVEKGRLLAPDGSDFFSFGCAVCVPSIVGPLADKAEHDYLLASNLAKVWGDAAYENWANLTRYRLEKWGMNTVAAWSEVKFAENSGLPFTVFPEKPFPSTQKKIYRDFPDVFSEEFRENARVYAESLAKYRDNPRVVGYFMTNEPHWAFVRELNLGYETFIGSPDLASKAALVDWLRQRFGTIELLNAAFARDFASFDDILRNDSSVLPDEAMAVLDEFSDLLIREFVGVPAQALRQVDPNHLNLGMRYAFISSTHIFAGSEFMDVFSLNCYDVSPTTNVEAIFAATGKPVMIGEFTFGALDCGLPATCIQGVATQADRGRAIAHYLSVARENPHCVGVHYFQLNDEPFLGRFDGENYNIGLVDICNREYKEVTSAFAPIRRIPAIFF